ncbi:hypothetical protein ACHAXA_007166 [Cyclostephanos tholiformis]|uniref:protein-tyrosine-phosphatase n=1 Tax=Cyclostephanos tholiformis TaxID=382380 RepID=A0ABD3REU6_9STRA
MEASCGSKPPTCRVAVVGAHRQRVAKIVALLRDNELRESIATITLACTTTQSSTAADTAAVPTDNIHAVLKGLPVKVNIEYFPCIATFDAYDDECGGSVRYLVKLEYHGPSGTLVRGKSLAPLFDDINRASTDDDDGDKNPFPGISAVAVGCGIEDDDDVERIRCFFEACSSANISDGRGGTIIGCVKPNPPYASIKEENEAFRRLSENEREEAISNGTFGPKKMVNFVHDIAKRAIRQRWEKEFKEFEEMFVRKERLIHFATDEASFADDVTIPGKSQCTLEHAPNPQLVRYACKRCRTALFAEDELEYPPHCQSLHNFRRKMHKVGHGSAVGSCQNHFIAQPLPWMDGCPGVEGKLHCPKCRTKVGHYSWTGAQCSCGTWVTPAIMIPLSKVDEMRPASSQNVMVSTYH